MAQTMTPAQIAKADAADAKAAKAEADAAPKPDPSLVPQLSLDTLGHLVGLVENIAGAVPMLHGLATRIAAMREAYTQAMFHATPAAPKE